MGIFGKKPRKDEAFKIQLEREAMDRMNRNSDQDFMLPFERDITTEEGINNKIKAPNVITAEELMGKTEVKPSVGADKLSKTDVEKIEMQPEEQRINSAEFLYQRMTQSRKENLVNNIVNTNEPKSQTNTKEIAQEPAKTDMQDSEKIKTVTEPTKSEEFDLNKAILELRQNAGAKKSLQVEKIEFSGTDKNDSPNNKAKSAVNPQNDTAVLSVDHISKGKDQTAINSSFTTTAGKSAEERRTSLLARCNAYLEDEEFGAHKKEDPDKYRLESVESILQDFEARASQRVQKSFAVKSTTGEIKKISLTEDLSVDKVSSKKPDTPEGPKAAEPTDISSSSKPITEDSNTVKHYFVAEPQSPVNKTEEKEDKSDTKIILDPKKLGLDNAPTGGNVTQVFTTVSSQSDSNIEKDFSDKISSKSNSTIANEEEKAFSDDYKSVADKDRIAGSLYSSKKRLTARVISTFGLLVLSLLILTPLSSFLKELGASFFYAVNIIISILAILFNFNIIKSLPALFKSEPDTDLPSAIAAITGLSHSIVCIIVQNDILPLTSVVLISLLFTNLAKLSIYSLISKNFNLISNNSVKKAISVITNKAASKAMVGNSIQGASVVCCGVKTTNVENFLKYSYCSDPASKRIQSITIIGTIVGFGLGLAAALLSGWNLSLGFTVFTACTCVAAAPCTLFISHLPFKAAAGRLKYYGAMLTGYRAANEFDHCNALALDSKDLFPEGSIRLVDMKLLSLNPIDQSLLDAEALANAIGSPIAGIFKQINNTVSTPTAPKVDSMVYEDKMGISGWVDDRRVFIGNRILLEGHGFTNLPPIELDKKIMRKGYFPVYLVSDNVPCAMFVVKYVPDEEISYELRRLCNTGTTVLVQNCDPNISANMICDYFGLYEETVAIMSKPGVEQYKIITEHKESRSAGAAYTDSICGLISTMTASINIKTSITLMSVLYVVFVILGIAAIGILSFTSLISIISPVSLIIFQLVTTLLIFLPPLLRRP